MPNILLCEDEPKLSRILAAALESAGYSVQRVSTGQAAIAYSAAHPLDIVVTDLRLPDLDGIRVLKSVRATPSSPDVIIMTAYATTETAVEAMRQGAYDYLIKPFSLDELRRKIARLLSRRALQEHNGQLQSQGDRLHRAESRIGTSARMREVFAQISQVACTDATVLFLGEIGTGKTLLARALHYQSRRRSGPLGLEHELINEAIVRTAGNKTEAAKLLGITRRRLYSHIRSMEAVEQAEATPKRDACTTAGTAAGALSVRCSFGQSTGTRRRRNGTAAARWAGPRSPRGKWPACRRPSLAPGRAASELKTVIIAGRQSVGSLKRNSRCRVGIFRHSAAQVLSFQGLRGDCGTLFSASATE